MQFSEMENITLSPTLLLLGLPCILEQETSYPGGATVIVVNVHALSHFVG